MILNMTVVCLHTIKALILTTIELFNATQGHCSTYLCKSVSEFNFCNYRC